MSNFFPIKAWRDATVASSVEDEEVRVLKNSVRVFSWAETSSNLGCSEMAVSIGLKHLSTGDAVSSSLSTFRDLSISTVDFSSTAEAFSPLPTSTSSILIVLGHSKEEISAEVVAIILSEAERSSGRVLLAVEEKAIPIVIGDSDGGVEFIEDCV